jgi:hypothetical protein
MPHEVGRVHAVAYAPVPRVPGFFRVAALAFILSCAGWTSAHAQETPRVVVELEAASLWVSRNDVRIPNDGGTRFSLSNLIGSGPTPSGRAEIVWNLAERHGVRLVYAPIRIDGSGVPDQPLLFAGATFAGGQRLDATYQFSSYRATYRYRFFRGDTWTWRVGGTAFVRDARVALSQAGLEAEDADVGVVPLAHLNGEARVGERWVFLLDLDVSAAPQGRAIDFGARMRYALSDRWGVGAGYRTIEGGADVTRVFNFAWLNAATASVALSF